MAATNVQPLPITAEDLYLFRNTKIVHDTLPKFLRFVVAWTTSDKDPDITFMHYIKQVRQIAGKRYKNSIGCLQGQTLKQLEKHKTSDTFDATLLLSVIRASCEHLAPTKDPIWKKDDPTRKECLIRMVGDLRNNIQHGDDLSKSPNFIIKIRQHVTQLLRVFGNHYSVPDTEIEDRVRELNTVLDAVQNMPITTAEVNHIGIKKRLKNEGYEEIKNYLFSICVINPINFLGDPCKTIPISTVFHPIKICSSTDETFDSSELLNSTRWWLDPKQADIKLVVGAAGSGKTTMLKKIGLDFYAGRADSRELMLYIECRDANLGNLKMYLSRNFHVLSFQINDNDLIKAVLDLRLLILVDGIDELNATSTSLLREIFYLLPRINAKIICTSRPEAENKFQKILPPGCDYEKYHVKDIEEAERPEFLSQYFQEMTKLHRGQQRWDIEEFLLSFNNIPRSMNAHFRYPISLVLYCHLYLHYPKGIVNLKTPVNIFEETLAMHKSKIVEREVLKNCSTKNIEKKIDKVIDAICHAAYVSLGMDQLALNEDVLEQLSEICLQYDLDCDEILSGLLVMEKAPYPNAVKRYCFSHKEFQEFYGSRELVSRLSRNEQPTHCSNLTTKFKEVLRVKPSKIHQMLSNLTEKEDTDITKFQNLLTFTLCQLMNHDHLLAEHLNELIGLLKEAGIEEFKDWCRVLQDTDCQTNIAERISKEIPTDKWTVTEHELKPASRLQRFRKPEEIDIEIRTMIDPKADGLDDLLVGLKKHHAKMSLLLWHHHNTSLQGCDDIIQHLADSQCSLTRFVGSIKNGASLGEQHSSMTWMNVTLLLPYQHNIEPLTEMNILRVVIHYDAPVPRKVTPLPVVARKGGGTGLFLELRGVPSTGSEWVLEMVTKLLPKDGWYRGLELKHCHLSQEQVEQLDQRLRHAGVCVRSDFELSATDVKFDHRTQTNYIRICIRDTTALLPYLHSKSITSADQLTTLAEPQSTSLLAELPLETWCLGEDDLRVGAILLQHRCPKNILVSLKSPITPLWLDLEKLLRAVRDHDCDLQVHFIHSFKEAVEPCDELLQILHEGKCRLTAFTGCVDVGRVFQYHPIIWLKLVLLKPSEHQLQELPKIRYLSLSLQFTEDYPPPSAPRPLPRIQGFTDLGRGTWLEVRGLPHGEGDWLGDMLVQLAPDHQLAPQRKWYRIVELTSCRLTPQQIREVETTVRREAVVIRGYYEQTCSDVRGARDSEAKYVSLYNR